MKFGKYSVDISHKEKTFFPEINASKGDLIDYYEFVSPLLIPFTGDRVITMQRFPDGIDHDGFFQKKASDYYPDWLKTIEVIIDIKNYEIHDTFIAAAVECIPEDPFSYETWDNWTKAINAKTGLKGKELYMPLRLILTGKEKGPELKNFLPLLNKETLLRKFGKI